MMVIIIILILYEDYIYCNMYIIYSKCESVVLPKLGEQIKGREEVFCPRCDCKYENRNTTIIKVLTSCRQIFCRYILVKSITKC
jgi:hypothetical protein